MVYSTTDVLHKQSAVTCPSQIHVTSYQMSSSPKSSSKSARGKGSKHGSKVLAHHGPWCQKEYLRAVHTAEEVSIRFFHWCLVVDDKRVFDVNIHLCDLLLQAQVGCAASGHPTPLAEAAELEWAGESSRRYPDKQPSPPGGGNMAAFCDQVLTSFQPVRHNLPKPRGGEDLPRKGAP